MKTYLFKLFEFIFISQSVFTGQKVAEGQMGRYNRSTRGMQVVQKVLHTQALLTLFQRALYFNQSVFIELWQGVTYATLGGYMAHKTEHQVASLGYVLDQPSEALPAQVILGYVYMPAFTAYIILMVYLSLHRWPTNPWFSTNFTIQISLINSAEMCCFLIYIQVCWF